MTNKELDILTNIIGGVESGGQVYGKRNYAAYSGAKANTPNEKTVTLGWAQNYGNEARKLCQMIFDNNPTVFRNADSANIEKKLKVDWVSTQWNPSTSEKKALIAIITTDTGKKYQDQLFKELMSKYIKNAESFGITDVGVQMMWCECEHLGGSKPVKRIFSRTAKPYSVDGIFASLMLDQQDQSNSNQIGDKLFQSRHECCVKWIKQYVGNNASSDEKGKGDNMGINNIIEKERYYNSIGYKEVGSTNNQKFSTIVNNAGLAGCQNQAWCATYQFALELEEFGKAQALKNWNMTSSNYCGYSVFETEAKFPSSKRGMTPRVGALVIFKQSHMGRVLSVNSSNRTFECGEGNTSNKQYERNGNSCAVKTYSWSDSKIKSFCYIDYGNISTPSAPSTPSRNWLQIGDSGAEVKAMQTVLIKQGFNCGTSGADGDFGPGSEKSLREAQLFYGLTADGYYGVDSKSVLTSNYVKRLQRVIGANVDGIPGSETLGKTPTISMFKNTKHKAVRIIQEQLNSYGFGTIDGVSGVLFDKGTKNYQAKIVKLSSPDGEWTSGLNTWKRFLGL